MSESATRADVAAVERPVFLFGCTWRCGSTLLQRALSSSNELFVWGENQGISALLREIERRLAENEERNAREWVDFRAHGTDAWIACLNPPLAATLPEALRAFYLSYFERMTREIGRARWGFKEVRHGARTAAFLTTLFPEARVIFLLRNPADTLASMSTMSWYGPEGGAAGVLGVWQRNTASMAEWNDPRLLTVRYEDLVAEPRREMERIADHVGLTRANIDIAPFGERVRGFKGQPTLGMVERRALCRPEIVALAKRAGYDVLADPRLRLRAALPATVYLRARALVLGLRRAATRAGAERPSG